MPGVAAVVWWLDRRIGWATGECSRRMWALYTLGRLWWELLRIDSATLIFGVRINVFTSVLVGLGAVPTS